MSVQERERKILINGRFIGQPQTGVQRYAAEMVNALDQLIEDEHPLTKNTSFQLALPRKYKVDTFYRHIESVKRGHLTGHAWEQIDLALFPRADYILNLCNFGPLLWRNNITCVHDAHVWLIPENFSLAFKLLYRFLLPLSIRFSRRWVTVSKYSADQLVKLGAANRAPDSITPNGCDHVLNWNAAKATLKSENLPAHFIFAVGNRSPNKNISLVYRLAKQLLPHGIAVVIAGGANSKVFGAVETLPCDNIIPLGRVSDNDLALLFGRAVCFVFPSLYEGFGIPALEAMLLGCPVVASNTSAMPEILGNDAILCDPNNLEEWLAAVLRLSADAELRQNLINSGRARASKFTWRTSAIQLLKLVQN